MDKTELFLNELESLLSRYFNTDWNYDFDFDKPITIDVPIQADDKLDTKLYSRNLPKSRVSHKQLHCASCNCQDPRLTDEEYTYIINELTEEGYESQTSDLASEWAYSSHLLQDRDEAIELLKDYKEGDWLPSSQPHTPKPYDITTPFSSAFIFVWFNHSGSFPLNIYSAFTVTLYNCLKSNLFNFLTRRALSTSKGVSPILYFK